MANSLITRATQHVCQCSRNPRPTHEPREYGFSPHGALDLTSGDPVVVKFVIDLVRFEKLLGPTN
jgi:hypothetical protein